MSTSLGAGLLAVMGLGLPFLALFALRRFPNFALWARALLAWRQSAERPRDMTRAAAYHACLPDHARAGALDDRTWHDLDLDDVFCALDRTESEPGRQYLYHLLRTPLLSLEPLERRERLIGRLARDAALSDRIGTSLGKLRHPRAGQLLHLALGALPARPRYWLLFPILTVTSVTSLILFLTIWPPAF